VYQTLTIVVSLENAPALLNAFRYFHVHVSILFMFKIKRPMTRARQKTLSRHHRSHTMTTVVAGPPSANQQSSSPSDCAHDLIMTNMQRHVSDSVPLSPEPAENARGRRRCPRIPRRNLPLVFVALFGLLASSSRFGSLVAADQGGYYNDYGGYDYGENNKYENYEVEKFAWPEDVGFDEVSVLPVSCIN